MRRLAGAGGLVLLVVGAAAAGLMETRVSRVTLSSGVAQGPSRQCGACHSPEFALWVGHAHSRFLVDPKRDPRHLLARWGAGTPGWEHVQGRFDRGDVALGYGVLETQVYFRRGEKGLELLPAQWDIAGRRWEPLPADLAAVRQAGTTWEEGCAGCHVTGFDPRDGSFVEANVGCAACHGDGAAHGAAGGRAPILRPSTLEAGRRAMICGACHARGRSLQSGRPYPEGFVPGQDLGTAYALEQPRAGEATAFFWADGTEKLPFMEYQGFVQSDHARYGLHCTSCHLPHGSDHAHSLRRKAQELCQGCHPAAAQGGGRSRAHGRHPAGAAACIDCHMPPLGVGLVRARSHTFRSPAPARSAQGLSPPGCVTAQCHPNRSAGWAADICDQWGKGP